MKTILRTIALLLVLLGTTSLVSAQCDTWVDSPNKEDAENAHVAYRNYVKGKTVEDLTAMPQSEFDAAFNNWKKAYEIAPAADGNRPFHYRDGRTFYKALRSKATDDAKKAEYAEMIFKLYDQELECYPKYEAFLLGRKGSDMFYLDGYSIEGIETLEKAMDVGGTATEYVVIAPLGKQLAYYFDQGKIDNTRVRELFDKASKLAEFNMDSNETYGTYYEAAKANLEADVLQYADQIFDCQYFKDQLMPKFEENKEDLEILKYITVKLKAQGCSEDDPDVMKVQAQYDAVYAEKAAEFEAERRRMNPAYAAQKAYEDGDFAGAVAGYQDAADKTDDDEKKAQYYYQMAQIQNAKLGQSGSARQNANRALQARPAWGKPYILIGDIYSKMSGGCGDAWQQRLAVLAAIDKYRQARSVDSEAAGDANRRIGRLSDSLPLRSDAFSRGLSEGDKVKVGCGIGETVTLRF